mgnify:CR=1 FL=1
MVLTVANFKGGSSKSLNSVFIGFSDNINATIYSNDPNGIYHSIFENYIYAENLNKIDLTKGNIVLDTGGFVDSIGELLSKSDVVLIPTLSDLNSLKVCLDSIAEFREYNKNILVVESMYKDGSMVEEAISENFPDDEIPVLKLRYAKVFDNALREGKTIHEYIRNDKLKQITYKNVLGDIADIIEVVEILGGLK